MALKTKKNLIKTPTEYTRYYGDFRGVDFSSEQTEVHDQRFAYAVNMYRDYRNSEGNVIETIPGFRRVFQGVKKLGVKKIFKWRDCVFVVIGSDLYGFKDSDVTKGVIKQHSFTLGNNFDSDNRYKYTVPTGIKVNEISYITINGNRITNGYRHVTGSSFIYFDNPNGEWTNYIGSNVILNYTEDSLENHKIDTSLGTIYSSCEFIEFDNSLYFITRGVIFKIEVDKSEPNNYKFSASRLDAYEPTVYKDIGTSDTIDISKYEYEQKNIRANYYNHTYVPRMESEVFDEDGQLIGLESKYPRFSNDGINPIIYITFLQSDKTVSTYFVWEKSSEDALPSAYWESVEDGKDTYIKIVRPTNMRMGAVALIDVRVRYFSNQYSSELFGYTYFTAFDGRVFAAGNPDYPNRVLWCGRNRTINKIDLGYWGELDYVQDGYDGKIIGMMPIANTLAVLKSDCYNNTSIYFHTRNETGESVVPVTYPHTQGPGGLGKVYSCYIFNDDPLFISKSGLNAISQLSVRLERSVEHRSYLVDGALLPMDLSKAKFAEWENYFVVLCPDGKIFLGDSRQKYAHSTGVMQYEWFYLEGIGVYDDYTTEYYYAASIYEEMPSTVTVDGKQYPLSLATNLYDFKTKVVGDYTFSPVRGGIYDDNAPTVYNSTDADGNIIYFTIQDTWDGQSYTQNGASPLLVKKAILCEDRGAKVGVGTFYPATTIFNLDGDLYFGTDNGVVCKFNFDMKNEDGTTPKSAYNFDGRTIFCGVATKLDNCGIPHLTKSTIKKSMVLKTKSLYSSAAKIKVRTNAKGYESVARISSNLFDENDMDFSDFSFAIEDNPILTIKEKEKHWVEKQHLIYSDEFEKPFSIHYLAFRYKVSGRIK